MTTKRIPAGEFLLSSPTSCAAPQPAPEERVRFVPLIVAAVLGVGLSTYVWTTYGGKYGILLVLGLALGFALFHSRFGFTSAWRQRIGRRHGIDAAMFGQRLSQYAEEAVRLAVGI